MPSREAAQSPERGYQPGGASCDPKRLDTLAAENAPAERERCTLAREDHRVQQAELYEAARANDLAEGDLRLVAQQNRTAFAQTIATLWAFIAAAVAAIFAGMAAFHAKRSADADNSALNETRKAAKAARMEAAEQASRIGEQLRITGESAAAAKEQARLSGAVLEHNQTRVVLTERAWVTRTATAIGPITPPPGDVLTKVVLTPDWRNVGRTPARNCIFGGAPPLIFPTNEPTPTMDFKYPKDRIMPPSIMGIGHTVHANPVTLIPDDIDRCARGDVRILLFYRAEYYDIFPDTPLRVSQYAEELKYVGTESDFSIAKYFSDSSVWREQKGWPFVFVTLLDYGELT